MRAPGLCRWDTDPYLSRVGLDDREGLALWCGHYMGPQEIEITELQGLNLVRFEPIVGF